MRGYRGARLTAATLTLLLVLGGVGLVGSAFAARWVHERRWCETVWQQTESSRQAGLEFNRRAEAEGREERVVVGMSQERETMIPACMASQRAHRDGLLNLFHEESAD